MANVKVKAASIFLNGKKVGNLQGTEYVVESGDEPVLDWSGWAGTTDGVTTTRVTASGFNPVPGGDVDIFAQILAHSDIDVAIFPIDGGIHVVTMRALNGTASSNHKSGSQASKYVLVGGAPKVLGRRNSAGASNGISSNGS